MGTLGLARGWLRPPFDPPEGRSAVAHVFAQHGSWVRPFPLGAAWRLRSRSIARAGAATFASAQQQPRCARDGVLCRR